MLNIISLSVLRKKITWPGKVVHNLIKGLDIVWYPYVLNKSLNATSRLWIHDDVKALSLLEMLNTRTKVIIWPNLYNFWDIPSNIKIDEFPYIMPCQWIVEFWKQYWYEWVLDVWPVWIDTDSFIPGIWEKNEVLIYFKKRFNEECKFIQETLDKKNIAYTYLEYGSYTEMEFKRALWRAKYVIWIWCPETQWIALWEVLSTNVPILLWDVQFLWHWSPANHWESSLFTEEQKKFSPVTSAPYFDHRCGKKVFLKSDIQNGVDFMEENYSIFSSREYIMENLSLALQARAFIDLYDKHYWLTFDAGMNEYFEQNPRSFHYDWLWRSIFSMYDSKYISSFRNFLSKK